MIDPPTHPHQHPFWDKYRPVAGAFPVNTGLRVLVLYFIHPGSTKWYTWDDGFVASLGRLSARGNVVTFFNTADLGDGTALRRAVLDADVVLVKSNWDWVVDVAYRKHVSGMRPAVLAISGISGRVSAKKARPYDVLIYQTDWYRSRLPKGAASIHAYGVNDDVMFAPDRPVEKSIDWLFVGKIDHARGVSGLIEMSGRRVAVGERSGASSDLLQALTRSGVEVRDYVEQPALRELYWQAHRTYVPASVSAGGERQVMESLRCGTPVTLDATNHKLAEVERCANTWTTDYFSVQVERALRLALAGADTDRPRVRLMPQRA